MKKLWSGQLTTLILTTFTGGGWGWGWPSYGWGHGW